MDHPINSKQLEAVRRFHSMMRTKTGAVDLEEIMQSDVSKPFLVPYSILFPFKKVEEDEKNEEKKFSQ
jgi:hypothetical protein